jgi:predicted flavoprotein YhiN
VADVSDREIKSIVSVIKGFSFEIKDTNGFDNAQVTAGGIKCSQFNPETMESKIVPGLYAAGEILNIDGDCGGFNLQWAFSSAYLAAHHACGVKVGEL